MKDDQSDAWTVAHIITKVGGNEVPMFISEQHPSLEVLSDEIKFKGSKEEMHDESPTLARVHIELKGKDRDKGLEKLGLLEDIMKILKKFSWI